MGRRYRMSGEWLHLAAVMLDGDLLVVACDDKPRAGLQAYGLRWVLRRFLGMSKLVGLT